MELTKDLIKYLDNGQFHKTIQSNFLLTDLDKIIYADTIKDNNYYLYKSLNNSLISLIEQWTTSTISEENIFVENNPSISIISNDTETYSAIMVFPIYTNNSLEGLAIYFRNCGNYISSSTKAPNTIRKWIMKFLGCGVFPVC